MSVDHYDWMSAITWISWKPAIANAPILCRRRLSNLVNALYAKKDPAIRVVGEAAISVLNQISHITLATRNANVAQLREFSD